MAKIIELLPSAAGDNARALAEGLLRSDFIDRLVLNLPGPCPSGSPKSSFAAAIEAWAGTVAAYMKARAGAVAGLPALASPIAYSVSERIQKDHEVTWPCGQPSPGIKAIYLVRRRPALSDQEAKARWLAHASVAVEHHVGMSRYVQHGVRLRLGPDAPVYDGIAVLHFPTMLDLEQRMYDSEEGRRAVHRDVKDLVAEALPLYTTEYILR